MTPPTAAADGTRQVYDVAHNVAKLEQHGGREVCVHRKGATLAFPPGSDEIPSAYRDVGQTVFIPGKDVERVVEVVEQPGLAARVAQLTPLGVVKG